MSVLDFTVTASPRWSVIGRGTDGVAAADRDALGTTARVVVWPPQALTSVLPVIDIQLAALDRQCSRFRADSEVSRLLPAGPCGTEVSAGLAEAVGVALSAARWTGGLVDPAIGARIEALGYDRDYLAIRPDPRPAPPQAPGSMPGYRAVRLLGRQLWLPAGVVLDLGATAKGLGADRAARAGAAMSGVGGILVSLGGDLAVAGQPPASGWPVLMADEHRQTRQARLVRTPRLSWARDGGSGLQEVRIGRGGLATSSVTCRRWQRAGQIMHHIIDPRTGMPAAGPWRTASVAAATCAEANAAATAAIIAGDEAAGWLTAQGLPARLVGHDDRVLLTCGWPEGDGGYVPVPPVSRMHGRELAGSRSTSTRLADGRLAGTGLAGTEAADGGHREPL